MRVVFRLSQTPGYGAEMADDDLTRVDALIDELLAKHDPATTDQQTFRGAQYDRRPRVGALPGGIRRSRASAACSTPRRTAPARGGRAIRGGNIVLRSLARGADGRDARERRVAPARAATDVHRRGGLVPALLGARSRFRPRRARDARGARRRRVDRERPESVEHTRTSRGSRDARLAYRPRRAQAQRAHLLHGRHARAGRRGSTAAPDHR